MKDTSLFVIGCGFLGKRFLTLYGPDYQSVYSSNRNPDKKPLLTDVDIQALCLDINDPSGWHELDRLQEHKLQICCFVTPGSTDREKFHAFLQRLAGFEIDRAVMTSSSVVYGREEREVDSDSPVDLDSDRAQRQFELELAWRDVLPHAGVIRLAGLYGADRLIGRKTLSERKPIAGAGNAWLNLIHVDDAASLVQAMLTTEQTGPVLGCDDQPLLRADYYAALAAYLNVPLAEFAGAAPDEQRGRRCNNRLTRERLDWRPRYATFMEFIQGLEMRHDTHGSANIQ